MNFPDPFFRGNFVPLRIGELPYQLWEGKETGQSSGIPSFFSFQMLLLLQNLYSAQMQASSTSKLDTKALASAASFRNQCRLESKIEAKFRSFYPPPLFVKLRRGVSEMSELMF